MMQWKDLLNDKRARSNSTVATYATDKRSSFKKDFDTVCNNTVLRRLQDKAQVFPLEKGDCTTSSLV